MKKIALLLVAVFVMAGCSNQTTQAKESQTTQESTATTSSRPAEDKYTKYLKDYVGRNASDVGTPRVNGKFMDDYGDATIPFVFITEDGEAVTEENIKNYVVESQDPEEGSPVQLEFSTDESGEELGYPDSFTPKEIILHVKEVESSK